MMNVDLVIFDLDGTLIDSSDDIAWAANKSLAFMGYKERDVEVIKENIGWGVKVLLQRLMPDEGEEGIRTARGKFIEYYWDHLNVKTFLYPGVLDTLKYLKESNKKMAVVTNKQIKFSEKILEELAIREMFDMVLGGDSLANRKPHPEPLENVISTLYAEKEKTVIVGDSPADCEAGKGAGIYTIGVEYGFRHKSDLINAGFDLLIKDIAELKDIIE
ncbi:MAG: HAD-IA family hydrolase [Nitrospirae bacterium]|nr:HAD-IA family hydrolase [Nitrospirota bacterium]